MYIIPAEKKKQLSRKFKEKGKKLFIEDGNIFESFLEKEMVSDILQEGLIKEKETAIGLIQSMVKGFCSYLANAVEQEGIEECGIQLKPTATSAALSLYDYNDDTRVYIYDNIIKDKAVVVYVPHEQDY